MVLLYGMRAAVRADTTFPCSSGCYHVEPEVSVMFAGAASFMLAQTWVVFHHRSPGWSSPATTTSSSTLIMLTAALRRGVVAPHCRRLAVRGSISLPDARQHLALASWQPALLATPVAAIAGLAMGAGGFGSGMIMITGLANIPKIGLTQLAATGTHAHRS